jgi:hypothetical protein
MRQHRRKNRHPTCQCGTGNYCPFHLMYTAPPPGTEADANVIRSKERGPLQMPDEHGKAGGGRRVIRKQIGGS